MFIAGENLETGDIVGIVNDKVYKLMTAIGMKLECTWPEECVVEWDYKGKPRYKRAIRMGDEVKICWNCQRRLEEYEETREWVSRERSMD